MRSEPCEFDPAPILGALTAQRIEFVVIGGYGAALHASPFFTSGVDVVPKRSSGNVTRLTGALRSLKARGSASADRHAPWSFDTGHGELKIVFTPSGTSGFDDLNRDATSVALHGVEVRVASLADIIRSKQAANRPKDQRVLPTLREILASRNPRNRPDS